MELTPFIDPLPIPQYCTPKERHRCFTYYEIGMKEFYHSFHRDLQPTKIWGYDGQFPGPIVNVNRGECAHVKWMNQLPDKHLLPIDRTLHSSGEHMPDVRTVVHLHGAEVESVSDGYPDAWFTNDFKYVGPVFETPVYKYNNNQRAATLWYHDHAIGITRLNVYAGLVGMYIIRDEEEKKLRLPSGRYEIPLIIADRGFREDGSLFYPDSPNFTPGVPEPGLTLPNPSVTPGEAFENITVNGKIWPFLEVERRKYRFRILNASNERFYRMKLSNGQKIIQIGSDGGLLEKPVYMSELLIAPSERMDVIIDFSKFSPDTEIILTNSAAVPFDFPPPIGTPPNPATDGLIMKFKVIDSTTSDISRVPAILSEIPKLKECDAERIRDITLDADIDEFGRFKFLLNNKGFMERISIKPILGDTEIWRFINVAGATHPMHIHLIQFQILDRIPFDTEGFLANGLLQFTGPAELPAKNERGWKDTVQSPPGYVTRVIMRFGPFTGRYVYHCHILEHEDYDMMRPFEVVERKCKSIVTCCCKRTVFCGDRCDCKKDSSGECDDRSPCIPPKEEEGIDCLQCKDCAEIYRCECE
ncbi:multicopper oxidase family protein [Sporosarcina sp. PTS2304]|uniref:multicopper oxidase family protein n=1 Tax=Sporosarcina sp. PTS2304 TaxID=2283194 RepID=UPI000E0CF01E|nr:multicopper oxidase domain-containing protein [Sporosarcina sp. PTS2304]AXI00614.1 multicopper oxidase family protein [Sporosarcina sp. PTS2304]